MGKKAPQNNVQSTSERMEDIMKAQIKYLPELSQVTSEQILPYEQKLLEASTAVQPQYTQAQYDLYKQYGPLLNELGMGIQSSNAQRQAAYEADILKNQGRDLALNAQNLQRQVDPEYFALRELQSKKLSDLLNSYDPSGLSGSESANVERNMNRMNELHGIAGLGTSSEAFKNSQAFDDRLQQKKSALAQALSAVPNALQSSRSGVDVMQQAVGRPSSMNTGENKFMSFNSPNIGAATQGMSSQLLNVGSGLSNQASSERTSNLQAQAGWDPYGSAKSILSLGQGVQNFQKGGGFGGTLGLK